MTDNTLPMLDDIESETDPADLIEAGRIYAQSFLLKGMLPESATLYGLLAQIETLQSRNDEIRAALTGTFDDVMDMRCKLLDEKLASLSPPQPESQPDPGACKTCGDTKKVFAGFSYPPTEPIQNDCPDCANQQAVVRPFRVTLTGSNISQVVDAIHEDQAWHKYVKNYCEENERPARRDYTISACHQQPSGDAKQTDRTPAKAKCEPQYISGADFDAAVIQSKLPVLVIFTASWCGPCKLQLWVVKEMALPGLKVCCIDTDANPDAAKQHSVRGIPTLIVFKGGSVVEKKVGAQGAAQLRAIVDRACHQQPSEG